MAKLLRPVISWLACWLFLAAAGACWFLANPLVLPAGSPHLAIIYTCNTNGFLQECGCSAGQIGGLAKRAALIQNIRSSMPGTVLLVDGGNLAADLRRSEAVMETCQLMNYQAISLGELEEKLGLEFIQRAESRKLFLTAWPKTTDGYVQPHVLLPWGSKQVGMICLRPGNSNNALQPFPQILSALERKAAWTMVFSPFDHETEKKLFSQLQGRVDLVIGMSGSSERKLSFLGDIAFVPATQKGEVGVIEIEWNEKGKPVIRHRLEKVSGWLTAEPRVQEAVSAYYAAESRRLLENSLVQAAEWREGRYQSSHQCAECHPAEAKAWRQSKHHRAAKTLKEKNRLVGECLKCHSEWYRRTGQFHAHKEWAWDGVECASCHGDGILHSALRGKEHIQRRVEPNQCRTCHDQENDPHFDYASYLEKIRHWKTGIN